MFDLRDYQKRIAADCVLKLQEYKFCYLALEVRTGKTLTALYAAEKYGAKVVLFVTKLKAISSISSDFDKLNPEYIIDIINYEQLKNVVRTDYDLVIVDEFHSCGAFPTPSERTRLLKKICAGLPIIGLSGSPSPESYSQLYHQFWISSFSPFAKWPTFYKWALEFVTMKKKYFFHRAINDYSDADKSKIDELTKHLFLSYTQQEAGFLRQVDEEVLTVRMHETTYALARRLQIKRIHIGKNGEEILADTAVKLMMKTWQIYSGSVIAEDKTAVAFDHTKAKFIKDKFGNNKIAIFYVFKAEYTMLLWTFGANRLTEDPQEFNQRSDKIFVSQIQSGSMGINLSTADYLIFYNIHFSSVLYQQARARIQDKHRTKSAKVVWIFSENGIEKHIYERVQAKQDFTLSYFKKIYKFSETPLSIMGEQIHEMMEDYGIDQIQRGSRIINKD